MAEHYQARRQFAWANMPRIVVSPADGGTPITVEPCGTTLNLPPIEQDWHSHYQWKFRAASETFEIVAARDHRELLRPEGLFLIGANGVMASMRSMANVGKRHIEFDSVPAIVEETSGPGFLRRGFSMQYGGKPFIAGQFPKKWRHNVLDLSTQREVSLPNIVFTALVFLVTRQ